MANLPKLVTASLIAFSLAGCASTPTGPSTLEDITPIEQGDSKAMKIVKLAKLDRNIKDLKVPEDFNTGGYSATRGAVDITTGALGVGVVNASGLSGSLSELGLGLLMSNKNAPYDQFTFISFLPSEDLSGIENYQKQLVESIGNLVSISKSRSGHHYKVIAEQGSKFSSCKPSTTNPCLFVTSLKALTKLSSTEASQLNINPELGNGSVVVQWSIPYDVLEKTLISGVPIKNTFLYVPHKNFDASKANILGEVNKMLTKVPYLIDLDSNDALFFLK